MTQELTIRRTDDRALAIMELETRFAMAVRQRELLESYIRERLQPDKHFYTIGDDPGRKPSLTKEGAELINLPHNLKPRYAIISGPESPPMDDAPFQITVNCELMFGDKFGGQGIGSASSMITRRDGARVQRQKDPGLRHNATLKMACKSAYIAATLNSTAASEFFTQDLEDDQTGSFAKHDSVDKSQHWCAEHKTAFFMKGKMKSFAHPIGDTGEWCHEHKDKPSQDAKPEPAKQAVPTADEDFDKLKGAERSAGSTSKRDPLSIKTGSDLFKACREDWKLTPAQVLKELNVDSTVELADLADAYRQIAAVR